MGTLLGLPPKATIEQLTAGERLELLHQMIRSQRELAAGIADVLDVIDTNGEHRPDGHRTVRNLLIAHAGDDPAAAGVTVRSMQVLRLLPQVRARFAAGEFGIAQVHSLAKAYGNPRVRDAFAGVEDQILDWADLPHPEFEAHVAEFTRLADADGAEQRDQMRHSHRAAYHLRCGDGYVGNYACGPAQGAAMQQVLDEFCRREFRADWAEAKARVGIGVTKADLSRTREQRKMDALQAIFVAAASTTADGRAPEPLVNLAVDERTLDETIQWVTTGVRPPVDLTDIASRRCHTTDGVRIPNSDMLAAALVGQVRRVVVNSAGVTIDMGRKARLFTGPGRDAVMLRSTHCVWAGCDVPASHCEADHLVPAGQGGRTDSCNGGPCCDHHNRWKSRGFTVHADADGKWHTHRPDGTSINGPPAA